MAASGRGHPEYTERLNRHRGPGACVNARHLPGVTRSERTTSVMDRSRVFFYGTLMRPFHQAGRLRVADHLVYVGRGTISAVLFDLGIYPAAVPASDATAWGEVYKMTHPSIVLQVLDEFEGCRTEEPDSSLYTRALSLGDARRRPDRRRVGVLLQRSPRPRRAYSFRRLPGTPET